MERPQNANYIHVTIALHDVLFDFVQVNRIFN